MNRQGTAADGNRSVGDMLRILVNDMDAFRARRRSTLLLPYDKLKLSVRHLSSGYRDLIDWRLQNGYERDGYSIPSITGPINWFAHNRSFAYILNAWEPITDILMGHSVYHDVRYFEAAHCFSKEWIERFQLPSFAIGPDPVKLNAVFGPTPWCDMAVGLRAYRLAYIVDVMARDTRYDEPEVAVALGSLIFHMQLLSRNDFFHIQHNHGYYQALGELAAARRESDEPFFAERYEVAADRVRVAVDRQFHSCGIHREHSPGYHYMVMDSLIGARAGALVASHDVSERITFIERALTWLIQPGGALLTFGDTDPRNMVQGRPHADRFENPHLRYQISGGSLGEPPLQGMNVLKDVGYVFARSATPQRANDPWWYLAQMASFHSRTHKHADDLSFVWSDQGLEILIDPGRFAYSGKTELGSDLAKLGFWYSDPKRVYVESTRAHNTVEIDGRSYNRRRVPYGSALEYAGNQGSLIVTECELYHFRTVRHWRVLVMNPGAFLLVVDWLLDRSGKKHDFRQHFHFHPDWDVGADVHGQEPGRLFLSHSKTMQQLTVVPLAGGQEVRRVVRGQVEPDLLGWYSDRPYSLVPCTTVGFDRMDVDFTVFATLLTFGSDAKALPSGTSVRRSMRPSVFAWEEGGESTRIELKRGEGDSPVTVALHQKGRV